MSWHIDTEGFHLDEPLRYRPWYNFLSNGDYGLKISHLADGYSSTLVEPRVVVTQYDHFTPNRGRFIYVKDGGDIWNPGLYPSGKGPQRYACTHAPGYTEITGSKSGIETSSLHILPEEGSYELWRVKVRNTGESTKNVQIFTLVEYLLYDSHAVDPVYFSWFTNSRYVPDSNRLEFFRTDQKPVYGFYSSSLTPDSWEAGLTSWKGNGDYIHPESVINGQLNAVPSAGEPYVGSFQYNLTLEPGQEVEWVMALGQGQEAARQAEQKYSSSADVEKLLSHMKAHWKKALHNDNWDTIDDPLFRAYAKTFLPYQVIQQATGLVRASYRGYRDVAQDAMGLSFFDIDATAELIRSLCAHMMDNGRCLRQWNTGGGFNDDRDFRDLPLWLPLAVDRYLKGGGSPDLLDEELPFFDSEVTATLWEHMQRGLEYVLSYGPHELLFIGVGDWNDALSGLGLKGESLWLNQMAYLSLSRLDDIGGRTHHKSRIDINGHKDRLYNGVIRGWNGEWFVRGYNESGQVIGGDKRIFLLPQAWFTISGMAARSPAKGKKALESMVQRLRNDSGLLICHPGFDEYDPLVGNLSCLAPGMAENFAVYNHASAFGVYSLFEAGMQAEANEFLLKLLPFTKDESITLSEPYVLVNFYNGGAYSQKAGRGGVPWLTGTVHWLAMILFDHLFEQEK